QNTQEATARHLFQLAGKVKEGDEVRYQIKALDNRSLPEKGLGPNVAYYPEKDRWLTLKVARQAQPLAEQEILAQRDSINKKLDAIKNDLQREQRAVYKVRQESRADERLKPEQEAALKETRKENRGTEEALREVAREASATPALEKVADQAQDVANQEMH